MVVKSALINKAPEKHKGHLSTTAKYTRVLMQETLGSHPTSRFQRADEDAFLLIGSETTPGHPQYPLDVDISIGYLGKVRHGAEQTDPFRLL